MQPFRVLISTSRVKIFFSVSKVIATSPPLPLRNPTPFPHHHHQIKKKKKKKKKKEKKKERKLPRAYAGLEAVLSVFSWVSGSV